MVIKDYISVISWRSVLLGEETGEHGEKYRPVANFIKYVLSFSSLWCFLYSMIWRYTLLLVLIELFTITVETFFSYKKTNHYQLV